jgi:hypothetical protein
VPLPLVGTGYQGDLWLGLQIAACGTNLLYCLIGVHLGTAIGVLPGPRSSGDDCDALSVTFRAAADIRADHAFWHQLRRSIRRLDGGNPRALSDS